MDRNKMYYLLDEFLIPQIELLVEEVRGPDIDIKIDSLARGLGIRPLRHFGPRSCGLLKSNQRCGMMFEYKFLAFERMIVWVV